MHANLLQDRVYGRIINSCPTCTADIFRTVETDRFWSLNREKKNNNELSVIVKIDNKAKHKGKENEAALFFSIA